MELENPQIFSLQSNVDEEFYLRSEIWLSGDALLTESAARFCHDWELAEQSSYLVAVVLTSLF